MGETARTARRECGVSLKGCAVFRQVVAIRWLEGASTEDKKGYRDALDALRDIPELLSLTWGDDAGHFEGNFDLVAVMDFADFDSARVYVEHPVHQAYVREHASRVVGERVVVQHDWTQPPQVDSVSRTLAVGP